MASSFVSRKGRAGTIFNLSDLGKTLKSAGGNPWHDVWDLFGGVHRSRTIRGVPSLTLNDVEQLYRLQQSEKGNTRDFSSKEAGPR